MPDPLISLIIAAAVTAVGLLIFWPERGLYWRWQHTTEMTDRVMNEDALKHIHDFDISGGKPSVESLAGVLNISTNQAADVISNLEAHDLIEMVGTDFKLTAAGHEYALRIIRAHRIYERYLAEQTGFEEAEWHTKAHQFEHQLSPEDVEKLAFQLGNPTHDPHGDPIPMADGTVVYPADRTTITQLDPNMPARIIHMEDEPEAVYAQLVAEGLHVGQEVRLLETSPQRVRFWAGGDEHVLAPILAANIAVVPVTEQPEADETPGEPLTNLKPGAEAQVVALSPRIRGAERRRLMDLGLLPGTTIEVEIESAGGDPIAYRVRGAVIALRKSQAKLISVCPEMSDC
jgi:DtxR family transcriptional regulator, Mn-dependent transcriptional regulator